MITAYLIVLVCVFSIMTWRSWSSYDGGVWEPISDALLLTLRLFIPTQTEEKKLLLKGLNK